MKRHRLFFAGICLAFASLAVLSAIVVLGLETRREVFILWEFIGNFCRGTLLISAVWILAVTFMRWKVLSRGLLIAGLSPAMSVLGIIAFLFVLDHARPNVKLYVSNKGSRDEMFIDVTTHYGLARKSVKPGEDWLVSEGRGFPRVLNVSWGTNRTPQFFRAFDVAGNIQRFGLSQTLRVTVTDESARLDVDSKPDSPANGSQPIRIETNRTSSADGSRR